MRSPLTEASESLMNRIDGKKNPEIAELLDISQKAVEKKAALKILKEQIENIIFDL
jgi:DNA-directed RNA polymerase specialized sigma24 family protein